jgi:hypothetical protein
MRRAWSRAAWGSQIISGKDIPAELPDRRHHSGIPPGAREKNPVPAARWVQRPSRQSSWLARGMWAGRAPRSGGRRPEALEPEALELEALELEALELEALEPEDVALFVATCGPPGTGRSRWRCCSPTACLVRKRIVSGRVEWLHNEMLKTGVAHGSCSRQLAADARPLRRFMLLRPRRVSCCDT